MIVFALSPLKTDCQPCTLCHAQIRLSLHFRMHMLSFAGMPRPERLSHDDVLSSITCIFETFHLTQVHIARQ